ILREGYRVVSAAKVSSSEVVEIYLKELERLNISLGLDLSKGDDGQKNMAIAALTRVGIVRAQKSTHGDQKVKDFQCLLEILPQNNPVEVLKCAVGVAYKHRHFLTLRSNTNAWIAGEMYFETAKKIAAITDGVWQQALSSGGKDHLGQLPALFFSRSAECDEEVMELPSDVGC
ncbi:hypothetical protein, partial [Piscirickettsia salmonis]